MQGTKGFHLTSYLLDIFNYMGLVHVAGVDSPAMCGLYWRDIRIAATVLHNPCKNESEDH